jgi:hypothetical protein
MARGKTENPVAARIGIAQWANFLSAARSLFIDFGVQSIWLASRQTSLLG